MSATWAVLEGDALARLAGLADESVQCCVTSPPYFGLRDYGVERQVGLEETPEEYVERLVVIFREVRRVLRPDGTLWLNLGDSFHGGGYANHRINGERWLGAHGGDRRRARQQDRIRANPSLKPKDLIGVPWMVAFALRADGWYLRQEVIWHKPNPMPESVTDRPTRAHEQLFLLTKRGRYYYDAAAIREPDAGRDHARNVLAGQPSLEPSNGLAPPHRGLRTAAGRDGLGRNKRSVWTIPTHPFPGAHFATFPPELAETCILAGAAPTCCGECGAPWRRVVERERSYEGNSARAYGHATLKAGPVVSTKTTGWEPTCDHDDDSGRCVVLDPFSGAGTTGLVAMRLDRSYVGIELNPEYVAMQRRRIHDDAPLLNGVAECVEARA